MDMKTDIPSKRALSNLRDAWVQISNLIDSIEALDVYTATSSSLTRIAVINSEGNEGVCQENSITRTNTSCLGT